MQRLQLITKVFFLVFGILLGLNVEVYAEQSNSVKDWLDNPEEFDADQKSPQETEDEKSDSNSSVGLTIWDFIKMIFATIFVIALLYFILKYINKKSIGYKNTQLVQNIGGASLGANRSVQIVKVGDRVFVLGVGDNIQLLKEIEDEEEARQIITEYNNRMDTQYGPSDIVTKVLKKAKEKNENDKDKRSFSSVLSKQLEEISKGRKRLYEEIDKKGPDEHE